MSRVTQKRHYVIHLEYSWSIPKTLWHTMDLEKEGKGNQEIAREQLDQWIKLDLFVGNRWCV